MMRHLLKDCGMRRIVFVGGPETNIDTQARYSAYADELRSAGYKIDSNDVIYLDYTYESAYRLAESKALQWTGNQTCVFAANDEMAAGVIAAAIGLGISVPQDLAVVGFDDTRVAQMTKPLLTTVRVPMSKMGATAIEFLCQRIAEPDREPQTVALPAELVIRDSCCSARR